MPRRKGYGIPPTKRIKIDEEIENNENETNNTSCENVCNEVQKTQNENYVKETENNSSESCPNGTTANGIKYLHKKFKKMAAILIDDCVPTNTTLPVSSGGDKSVYISTAPSPACSPVAPPSCALNVMTAAVATTTVTATLPFEDKPGVPAVIGRHACPYCKLVCNKPSVLQKHIRAHTNERPYPCLPCGFAFKTRSNLYKHYRSRSHSLKLEEVSNSGGSNNTSGDLKVLAIQEEEADEEDDNQNISKDEDSASGEEKTEQPRKSIYKPKFHKAAIYIQNNGSAVAPATKSEQVMTSSTSTLNKLGLQLKIPTTTVQSSSRSTPSTPSFRGSSPSPEFLHRHISKLISENQAIVETTDPFWSRKFYQRSKENSSPLSPLPTSIPPSNFEQLKKKQQSLEIIEEKLPSAESKLANALLHPRPVVKPMSINDNSTPTTEESQPLNLTMSKDAKFVRPTSLPLQPGTFVPKKLMPGAVAVLPLISPETPRPNKSYGQLYIGGNAYTYLGLKCSTRSTFCTLHKSQPTYVPLSPEHNKISMYSNWKVRSEVDPYLRSVSAMKAMACYDSRQRYSSYTVVHAKMKDAVTHSSYWVNRTKLKSNDSNNKGDSDDENKQNNVQTERVEEDLDSLVTNAGNDNEEEDGEDDENEDDYNEDDPKCQLEREVAKSLLSLSKISHQTVSEQYANAGLVPLNARPNTYPYNYSAITYLSSKPHTPTLMLISEQKERETVSKNTGLARELQPALKPGQMIKQKCNSLAQSGERYYFGSSSEKKVAKNVSDLPESVIKDSATVTSVFPIDLSSKNASTERKILVPTAVSTANTIGGYLEVSSAGISEILTPVSEPVLLATICSTIDRLSAVTGGIAPPPPSPVSSVTDATEGSVMLQTYLKERAVQDLKIKQQYQSPHIKVEQRDFDVKFNVYNEAFQKGAAVVTATAAATASHPSVSVVDKPDDVRTTPSPKRKNHFVYENDADKAFLGRSKLKIDRVSDSDSKENFAVTPVDAEKGDCSTSVIILVGSPNANANNSPKKLKAEFISPCSGPLPKYASVLEDGRSKCVVCNKVFSKPSQLRLHVNIHYFEQPFRCEACAVSFRTKGHLHKHLGSNSHLNKVSMNSAGNGQTSTNNPRPFKCDDCSVGFRIHGHLAKHLRSKMHIMKLECLGKLPFGTCAEMERCGINMNDIDTTDCENSLESLQRIAKGVVGSVMYVNNADEENAKMIADNTSF